MTLSDGRRPAFAREMLRRIGLAWLLTAAVLLATNAKAILAGTFPDPDDALRLIQVRDLLAGQGWFDLTQHRIDALAGGVPMHWSRLVDIPLAGMMLLLAPLLGTNMAENVTVVLVPMLTLGIAMLLAGRITWRLLGIEAATLTCLVLAMAVPLISQMRPLRIDHHGWQVVAALLAVNGLLARNPRVGGWIAGFALAIWLAISLEGLPFAAAFCGLLAWRWLRDPAKRSRLISCVQALAAGSMLLFGATRGLADLVVHCDAISPPHLAALGWVAVIMTISGSFPNQTRTLSVAALALAGGGALAIILLVAPQCATGSFDMLDPVVRKFWYQNVGEGLPVWQQDIDVAMQTIIPAAIAVWASLRLARRTRDWQQRWWQDFAMLLGAALVIALLVNRAAAVAGALAAIPLGWQLKQWLEALRLTGPVRQKLLAVSAIMLALLPAIPFTLYSLATPGLAQTNGNSATAGQSAQTARASTCRIPDAAETLRQLPRGQILAPLDIGPRLLLDTRHSVVATGHHRANTAMRQVIDAFTGTAETAHQIALQRQINYVVMCPNLAEPVLYAKLAPAGFAAQLRDGKAPAWLAPVAMPASVNLMVWRVVR